MDVLPTMTVHASLSKSSVFGAVETSIQVIPNDKMEPNDYMSLCLAAVSAMVEQVDRVK